MFFKHQIQLNEWLEWLWTVLQVKSNIEKKHCKQNKYFSDLTFKRTTLTNNNQIVSLNTCVRTLPSRFSLKTYNLPALLFEQQTDDNKFDRKHRKYNNDINFKAFLEKENFQQFVLFLELLWALTCDRFINTSQFVIVLLGIYNDIGHDLHKINQIEKWDQQK